MHYRQSKAPRPVLITKAIAERHAALPMLGMDRKLNPVRLGAYVKMIEAGVMRPVPWAVARCIETCETYRVNGQHTANAYASVAEIPADSYAIMEEYVCDTIADVAHLWKTYDSALSVRNSTEIMRAFAVTDPLLGSVATRVLMTIAGSIRVHKDGGLLLVGKNNRNDIASRASDLLCETDFAMWVNDTFTIARHPHLMRTGAIAAMYATWGKCQRDTQTFWTEVREESNPDNRSATRKCAKMLWHMYADKKSNPSTVREQYGRCILLWNAYRKNTSTEVRYIPTGKTPAVA